jgi:chemotaxis protein CheC
MELSNGQKDALTELINIGYGRAAGALSELTGYRVSLEVPQVAIHEIEKIGPVLEAILGKAVASVSQGFSGPVSGNALLLLDEPSALVLGHLLSEGAVASHEFDANTREIITEVGNILLNACLGVFGNLLHLQVNFAVPRLHLESVPKLLQTVAQGSAEQLSYGLMIHTRFNVKTGDVTGYLIIVLGIASLDRLLLELNAWENRQLQ